MIRFVVSLLPTWAWFTAAAVVLALSVAFGNRQGAARVQARWDAAEVLRERLAADQRREDGRINRAAAREFQSWLAQRERQAATLAKRMHDALQRPVSCPASGRLADVPVPADVVDGLRDAGADGDPPGPAGSGSGPGVQDRP